MKKSTLRVDGTRVGCALLMLAASFAAPLFAMFTAYALRSIPLFLGVFLLLGVLAVIVSSPYMAPRKNVSLFGCVILLLSAFVAFASLAYLQPPDCHIPICEFGEQTAGFPLPILRDNSSGGSPLSSIGRMDFNFEDIATFNMLAFYADVAFYAVLLWLPLSAVRLAGRLVLRSGRLGFKSLGELKPH